MLNNIKISQDAEKIVLNVNVVADVPDVIQELEEKMPKIKEFYKNEEMPIKITGKLFTEGEIQSIKKVINSQIDVKIIFDNPSELLGLHAIKKTYESEIEISETKYVFSSLRSGQKEEYSGSIVIIGDVNAGAEVFAGGNIIIVGTLRGVVHAGANGNVKAVIAANLVEQTQIRIANLVKEITQIEEKFPYFEIENGEIVRK